MNKTYHINLKDLQELIESCKTPPVPDLSLQGFVFTPSNDSPSELSSSLPEFFLSPVYNKNEPGTGVSGDGDIIQIKTSGAGACPYPPGYPRLAELKKDSGAQ